MGLNKKISFKCTANEIVNNETEDEGTADVEESWEFFEYNILPESFQIV